MSEKLGRDVGLRVACIDFPENIQQAEEECLAYKQRDILNAMGACVNASIPACFN